MRSLCAHHGVGLADLPHVGLVGEEGLRVLDVQNPDDQVRRAVQPRLVLQQNKSFEDRFTVGVMRIGVSL